MYAFLKFWSRLALPFWFCRWEVTGEDKLPGGPVIFVANHRNAFLDAILIASSSAKNPWFVTRADVFRKPLIAKLLKVMRMLPVYRFRDGFGSMKQNGDVISACVSLLNSGHSMLIFPEGNHGSRHHIRPLQKGVARIAYSEKLKVAPIIVPVGLYFESLSGFRSRVLVSFGDPVDAKEYETDSLLLHELSEILKRLTLHINHDRYDEKLTSLQQYRIISDDMTEQLRVDQSLIQNLTDNIHFTPEKSKKKSTPVEEHFFQRLIKIYVKANLFPAALMIHQFILSKIEDTQFKGSVKFSAGMVLVPVFLLIQTAFIFLLSGNFWVSLLYLISVPFAVKSICQRNLS